MNVRRACKDWNIRFSGLLCENIGPIAVARFTKKSTKFIKRHRTSVKTLLFRHIWTGNRQQSERLDTKLVGFLDIFKKQNLVLWGFTSDSTLSHEAYQHVMGLIGGGLPSSSILLPAMHNGSLFTRGNTSSPCNAVISFSKDCGSVDGNRIRQQHHVYIRKNSGLGAAGRALNRPGVMIEGMKISGNKDLTSVTQFDILWLATRNTDTRQIPKLHLYNTDLENLSGIFSLGDTQSIAFVNNRGPSSRQSYSERDLLKELTKPVSEGEKPLVNELIHRQTVRRLAGSHNNLSAGELEAAVKNVDGLQVLCFHQVVPIELSPAVLVQQHFNSLQVFSYRNGEEDLSFEHLCALATAAPRLRAIGFNYSGMLPDL
jgi:hypothetical protein